VAGSLTRALGAGTLIVLMQGGCAVQPCTGDPATDPYRCVEGALKSGLYAEQLDDLRARRSRLESQSKELLRVHRRLQLHLLDANAQHARQLSRLSTINTQLTELNRQLLAINEVIDVETPLKNQLERRQQQLVELQRTLADEATTVQTDIINELEMQIGQLRTTLDQARSQARDSAPR
jgi:hypothetical protein